MTNKQEIEFLTRIFPDIQAYEVTAPYELFHFIIDDVKFIAYPHKVKSTGNSHIRIRNATPNSKDKFRALASIIQGAKLLNCYYHVKNDHGIWKYYEKEGYKLFPQYNSYWQNALKICSYNAHYSKDAK